MDHLEQEPRGQFMPGAFPQGTNTPDTDFAFDEEPPKRKALKEEYVSPEWKSWREGDSKLPRPDFPVDIVAVQGLASEYERTWTRTTNEDGIEKSVMWLKDLLPLDLPCARILTFEYNSKWMTRPASVTLEDCARQLLDAIRWDRAHKDKTKICKAMSKRPLILLGHSYGGLVIKQAMVLAGSCLPKDSHYEDFQSILSSVTGILYLGTPHAGSSLARYGVWHARFSRWWGNLANPDILEPLQINSDKKELSKLQVEFHELRNDSRVLYLQLFYFWETEPSKILGQDIAEVVSQESACLGAMKNECMPLNSSHKYMNKFASRDESNYKKVRDCLRIIYDQSKSILSRRLGKSRYGSQFSSGKLVQLRDWLDPMKSTDSREDTLRRMRFESTCEWAMRLDVVSRWLDPGVAFAPLEALQDGRCLWIYGKPGSGKSVLSAYLYDQITAIVAKQNSDATRNVSCPGYEGSVDCAPVLQTKLWTALYFPFHGNATLVQAMATLIHRILLQHPANEALHDVASKFQDKPITEAAAMELLTALIHGLSLTYIVVDGLDECAQPADGQNQYEVTKNMEKLLKDLSKLANVRLLILSRRDRMLGSSMSALVSTDSTLDMAEHNSSDIKLFIDMQISNLVEGRPLLANLKELVVSYIASQSRGMFQWVKLVIQQLEFENGDGQDILDALKRFPKDLNDAYRKTLDRLGRSTNYAKDRAVLALKWLACSRRAFTTRELRIAIEIQEMIPHFRVAGDIQDIQSILARLDEINEDELKEYFIQLLGPLAEFYPHNSIINVTDDFGVRRGTSTVIRICHHSLTQLLFSSHELDGFEFSNQDAHFLAADTCMKMMCSPRAFETFLKRFDTTGDSDGHPIFLDYAVEHWSSHLRASGIKLNGKNLSDLTIHVVSQILNMSLLSVGALSEACSRLSMAKVEQLMQAIAIRDCQALMLPSIDSIVKLRQLLPNIGHGLGEVRVKLESLGRLSQNPMHGEASNQDGASTPKEITLDIELDSTYMVEIFATANKDPKLYETIRGQLEAIRQTSRNLRSLTIKLSVDPIRAWLYNLIGGRGLKPIVVLALTTHSLDVLLASFLLPPSTNDQMNFRDQFSAQVEHPLHGFIQSARNEVAETETKVLNAGYYKDHVLPHYLLKKSQWLAVYFTTILLGSSSFACGGFATLHGKHWHPDSMMIAYEGQVYDDIRFSDAFDNYGEIYYKEGVRTTFIEMVGYISTIVVAYFAKVLTLIHPRIGLIISRIADQIHLKTSIFRPWIISLAKGWRHSSFAFLLYLLRLNYCFWLFSYPRKAPWTDLKGILNDPFNYKSSIEQVSWTVLCLVMLQESFMWHLITYDVFQSMTDNKSVDGGPLPEPRAGPRPLYRQISWFKELGPSVKDNIVAIGTKLLRHAREIAMALARMIFIERTFYEVSYIIFDILHITVQLLTPASWTLTRVLIASYGIVGQAVLIWCLQRMGVRGTLRFFWHLYIYWLRAKVAWHILTTWRFFRYTLVTPSIQIWNLIKLPFVELFAFLRWMTLSAAHFILLAAQYVTQVVWLMGPTVLVILTAILLVIFFTVFTVILADPLQLRRAAYSCKKARMVAVRALKDNQPLRTLEWQIGYRKRIESIELVDLKQLNYLGAKSANLKPKTTVPTPKTPNPPSKTPTPAPKVTKTAAS